MLFEYFIFGVAAFVMTGKFMILLPQLFNLLAIKCTYEYMMIE